MATSEAPTTIGEMVAGTSRVSLVSTAVYLQVVSIGSCLAMALAFKSTDPQFFSSIPWRLPLLISFFVYLSTVMLILCYMALYLPRAPVAAEEALKIVGLGAIGGGVLNIMLGIVLGLPVHDSRVVVACTCFTAVLIAGLLMVWAWLVREYRDEPSDLCEESQSQVEVTSGTSCVYEYTFVARVPV
jgi:hypothetical protein